MTRDEISKLSDEELCQQKKKMTQDKTMHAFLIGFLVGVLLFGLGAWIISAEKNWIFLLPNLFTFFFLYRVIRRPKGHQALEEVLKDRNIT